MLPNAVSSIEALVAGIDELLAVTRNAASTISDRSHEIDEILAKIRERRADTVAASACMVPPSS